MNRELLLVRHGSAVPAAHPAEDPARPLSSRGRREVRALAEVLAADEAGVDTLVHSPLLRALETAEILSGLVTGELRVDPRLAEAHAPGALAALAAALDLLDAGRIALVGHAPHLPALAAWLAFGDGLTDGAARGRPLALAPGGLIRLAGELRPGGMRLLELAPPARPEA